MVFYLLNSCQTTTKIPEGEAYWQPKIYKASTEKGGLVKYDHGIDEILIFDERFNRYYCMDEADLLKLAAICTKPEIEKPWYMFW